MEVTGHKNGKYSIERLIYFPFLFLFPNHMKKNKGVNIIFRKFPVTYFIFTVIPQFFGGNMTWNP